MAGGRGSRMKVDIEKPLIRIGEKTILEHVVRALIKADLEVLVAISRHAPLTALRAREMGLNIVDSPGAGYVGDIQFLFRKLGLDNALVVSADLPFISHKLIRNVVKKYREVKRPICVAIAEEDYRSMGFTPSTVFEYDHRSLLPVGVNVVEKERGEDYFYIISGKEAINVNIPEELELIGDLL